MISYNEKSGIELDAAFFDAFGVPTLPSTVEYRLDCDTTRKTLLDYTTIAVVSAVDSAGTTTYTSLIEIPGPLNAIQNNRNAQEVKKLLVVANRDQASEYSQEYTYAVRNLRGR